MSQNLFFGSSCAQLSHKENFMETVLVSLTCIFVV